MLCFYAYPSARQIRKSVDAEIAGRLSIIVIVDIAALGAAVVEPNAEP